MDGASFFTAELNKVFGKEMANMISAEITDEELLRHAKNAWQDITTSRNYYSDPELRSYLKKEYMERLKKHISDVIQEQDEKALRAEAESIVKQIMDEARKKMIDQVSDNMAYLVCGSPQGGGMRSFTEHIIYDVMNR